MSRSVVARAAIIGAGLMGRWHAHAVARIGGRVTVIVDSDRDALAALAARYPEARRMSELDPVFVAQHAAAAHVCTPLATHGAIIASLIEARVNVLAEKPLAENADGTATLLALAQRHGVILCPVHQFLFQEGVQQVATWLPAMQPVRRIEFSTCSAGAVGYDDAGLDALIGEILPHPLSLFAVLTGHHVAHLAWQTLHPAPGEFRAMATTGGTVLDLAISAHGRPPENFVRVVADGGSAVVDLFHGYAIRHGPAVSRGAKIARPFLVSGRNVRGATANLMRRVVRREPAYPGLRTLVDAFYASIAQSSASPITADAVSDVAQARDRLLSTLSRHGTES